MVVSDVCRPLRARPRARRPRHFRRGAAAAASRSRVGAAGRGGQPASQPASRRWCEEGGALWPLHTAAAGGRCRTRVQPLRAARRTAVSASCSSCSSASCASSSARAARASSCASSCRDGAASVVAGGGGAGTAGAKAAAGCRGAWAHGSRPQTRPRQPQPQPQPQPKAGGPQPKGAILRSGLAPPHWKRTSEFQISNKSRNTLECSLGR